VVWYGKLKVDARATPVIFDPLISPSIKGCIYLYNAERDQIVQYAWDIVKNLLADVDKSEKSAIKKSIDGKWKAARRAFTRGKEFAVKSSAQAQPVVSPAPNERRWDSVDDDSFELEDLS